MHRTIAYVLAASAAFAAPAGLAATFLKIRRLSSIGSKSRPCDSSISALPRKSTPFGTSAKWNRERILDWVSALKYINVFRQASRSILEIGASWTRSLRPKMTDRRRSLRTRCRSPFTSKYFSCRSAGTPCTSRSL